MFNGFTPAAGDFLWELAFNNERVWFSEHKEQFEQTVNEPFTTGFRSSIRRWG